MKKRKLGINGPEVSAIGFGCMGLSEFYGKADDEESKRTLFTALDAGITHLDTADCYADGANEKLIAEVLKEWKGEVFIASKFGIVREPGVYERKINGRPEYVRKAVEASLRRLGIETIDLYYYHRIDASTPIEETVGAMADLVKEGKIRHIGISEASPDTIRRAHQVYPLTAVQSEYSLMTRHVEQRVFPVLRELGIGFVAYSPLSRGLLSGQLSKERLNQEGDLRTQFAPRLTGKNYEFNQKLVDVVTEMAKERGVTTAQLSLAWMLSKGEDIVPIPGTKRSKYLLENIKGADLLLSQAEVDRIENAVPADQVKGARYTEAGFVGLDDIEMI